MVSMRDHLPGDGSQMRATYEKFVENNPYEDIGDLDGMTIRRFTFSYPESGYDSVYFYVVDGDQAASCLEAKRNHRRPDEYQVGNVRTHSDYAGQALSTRLYLELARSGMRIMSDFEQTPGGAAIWKRLAKMAPDHGMQVRAYHVSQGDHGPVNRRMQTEGGKRVYGRTSMYQMVLCEDPGLDHDMRMTPRP